MHRFASTTEELLPEEKEILRSGKGRPSSLAQPDERLARPCPKEQGQA
jgi:hypothetical protein